MVMEIPLRYKLPGGICVPYVLNEIFEQNYKMYCSKEIVAFYHFNFSTSFHVTWNMSVPRKVGFCQLRRQRVTG